MQSVSEWVKAVKAGRTVLNCQRVPHCILLQCHCKSESCWIKAANSNSMQCPTSHCKTVQNIAIHCNTVQNLAKHCKTVQNIVKQCKTVQQRASKTTRWGEGLHLCKEMDSEGNGKKWWLRASSQLTPSSFDLWFFPVAHHPTTRRRNSWTPLEVI